MLEQAISSIVDQKNVITLKDARVIQASLGSMDVLSQGEVIHNIILSSGVDVEVEDEVIIYRSVTSGKWEFLEVVGKNRPEVSATTLTTVSSSGSSGSLPDPHILTGTHHSESGLTIGHTLVATGATAFAWQQMDHANLTGITSDQHHSQVHTLSGSDHTGDLVFTQLDSLTAAPTISLGTSGAIGTATSIIRSDATIEAFDTSVPSSIVIASASTGSIDYAARRDHVHGVSSASPVNVDLASNAEGSETTLARSDHKHYLDEAITPTWTSNHTFSVGLTSADIYGDGTLTLHSTSSPTKGKIYFGANSVYDELNDRLGIQTTFPAYAIEVNAAVTETSLARGTYISVSNSGAGGASLDIAAIEAEVDGTGTTASKVTGGKFTASVQTGETATDSYGLYGYGLVSGGSSTSNYGVYGIAVGGTTAYGVYGTANGGSTNYAGYFNGNTHVVGNFTLTGTIDTVDLASFKTTYDAHDHSAGDPTQVDHDNLTNVTSDQHHNQSHILASTTALGTDHTVSGLTAGMYLRATGSTTAKFQTIQAGDLPGSFSGFANPTASVGLTVVNGSASTAMRSDAAPALDQSIVPTWTGLHTFQRSTEQVRMGYDGSDYASFTVSSGGNLTIAPTGDFIFDPAGNYILPNVNYDLNFGSDSKKYLSVHGAELNVGTLVAAQTQATIGGRVVVAPTAKLTADSSSWANDTLVTDAGVGIVTDAGDPIGVTRYMSVTVDLNPFSVGDTVYMESGGKVEYFYVFSGPTGSGPYTYILVRDRDGTGNNTWYAGDAIVSTGNIGDGFIDIYSVSGIKNGTGPSIVGNVRDSTTYNDWTEHWAIGNLNGLYGYGSDTYGVGLGKYSSANYLTIDATNGIRFFDSTDTTMAQLTGTTWTLGDTSASNTQITNSTIQLRVGTTPHIELTNAGTLWAGDTSTTERLEWDSTNGLIIYDHANTAVLTAPITGGLTIVGDGGGITNIDGGNIQTGTVTATQITGTTLSAIYADMGSLTAGNIVITMGTDHIWLNDSDDGALNIGGATKASAPFQVTATGDLTATSATITGAITATSGELQSLNVTGTLNVSTAGVIKSGQTAYDTGTGYWIDYNGGSPRLSLGAASGNKLTWDGTSGLSYTGGLSGGQFDGVLSIASAGGIYQGTGTFASPTTGLKIYNSGGVGLLEMWGSSTKQVYFNTTGQLVAGGGTTALDLNGITIDISTSPGVTERMKWADSSHGDVYMIGQWDTGVSRLAADIYAVSKSGTGEYSQVRLNATDSTGSVTFLNVDSASTEVHIGANGIVPASGWSGAYLGSATYPMGTMTYQGNLKPYRNSTAYTGYIFIPLTTKKHGTNTFWGQSYSTKAKKIIDCQDTTDTGYNATDGVWYAGWGLPAGIKAVLLGVAVSDSGSTTLDRGIWLSPNNVAADGLGVFAPIASSSRYNRETVVVPCDVNGDIYIELYQASSLTIYIAVWGYWL